MEDPRAEAAWFEANRGNDCFKPIPVNPYAHCGYNCTNTNCSTPNTLKLTKLFALLLLFIFCFGSTFKDNKKEEKKDE